MTFKFPTVTPVSLQGYCHWTGDSSTSCKNGKLASLCQCSYCWSHFWTRKHCQKQRMCRNICRAKFPNCTPTLMVWCQYTTGNIRVFCKIWTPKSLLWNTIASVHCLPSQVKLVPPSHSVQLRDSWNKRRTRTCVTLTHIWRSIPWGTQVRRVISVRRSVWGIAIW